MPAQCFGVLAEHFCGGDCPEQDAQELWVTCSWSAEQAHQGSISTGDLIYTDESGYWFYQGRKDQMQVVGGLNVYPKMLEQQILGFEAIRTVKVTVQKDAALRSYLHAAIGIHPDFNPDAFEQYLAEVLPEHRIHVHISH